VIQITTVVLFVKSVTKIAFIREYGNINRFTYDYGHSFFVRVECHDNLFIRDSYSFLSSECGGSNSYFICYLNHYTDGLCFTKIRITKFRSY
jgi:hypothetical protein